MDQIKVLFLCGLVVLAAQFVNLKGNINMVEGLIGLLLIIAISVVAMLIKEVIPLQIPSFAWASLLALLLTTPWSPVQNFVLDMTKQFSATAISSGILAIAGISIGNKLADIKKLSWKIVLVAFIVFTGTFFGSAIVAEIILKVQGII